MVFSDSNFSFHRRDPAIRSLQEGLFDVLVIGGGINGAGILRDLSLRAHHGSPLRLALIEKDQFAHAASSKNSQLVHGGLRYLKYLELNLVKEALHERATLLRIAPHAVWSQPFFLPIYKKGKRWFYGVGVKLYQLLSGTESLGGSRWLSAREALKEEPELNPEGLQGAFLFYDAQMHASRLVLDQLRESAEHSAVVANFVEFRTLVPGSTDKSVYEIHARDSLRNEPFVIRARTVVNTIGPWNKTVELRLVRGSHLVLPGLTRRHALAFFEDRGRILFVLPYGPDFQFSLVGTTEKEQLEPEPVLLDPEEEAYLREKVAEVLPQIANLEKLGHYSAVRPLISDKSSSMSAISREHHIWKTSPGVYHVGGGKYTTFRLIAEQVADQLAREHLTGAGPCVTGDRQIDGNHPDYLAEMRRCAGKLAQEYGISVNAVKLLIHYHGRRAEEILALCNNPEYRQPLLPDSHKERLPFIRAQLHWAIENDMAGRLADFLHISTPLGYLFSFSNEARARLAAHFPLGDT